LFSMEGPTIDPITLEHITEAQAVDTFELLGKRYLLVPLYKWIVETKATIHHTNLACSEEEKQRVLAAAVARFPLTVKIVWINGKSAQFTTTQLLSVRRLAGLIAQHALLNEQQNAEPPSLFEFMTLSTKFCMAFSFKSEGKVVQLSDLLKMGQEEAMLSDVLSPAALAQAELLVLARSFLVPPVFLRLNDCYATVCERNGWDPSLFYDLVDTLIKTIEDNEANKKK
jgi:hypothetical protein